ncbi:MAG: PH domain-containing protein [Candidatus Altiarchaeota archaeon]
MNPGQSGKRAESGFTLGSIINELTSFFTKSDVEAEIPKLKLHAGEKMVKILKPHVLSFYDMYFVWAYVILVSVLFLSFGSEISDALGNPVSSVTEFMVASTKGGAESILMPDSISGMFRDVNEQVTGANNMVNEYAPISLWITLLVAASVVFSVLKISWKWIGILVGVGVGSAFITIALELPAEVTYLFGVLFSVIGILMVDKYRRSHTFFVTNQRIVTQVSFIDHKRNELGYDKINNLIMERTLIARLFNFGTIIPVTASGLGMGSDLAMVTIGAAGSSSSGGMYGGAITGGRTVQTPRVRSMYGLYGVEDPEALQEVISDFMQQYAEAPYLRRMTEQLDEMKRGFNNNSHGNRGVGGDSGPVYDKDDPIL